MIRFLFALSLIAIGFAAEDPWAKVTRLKSGSELIIVKTGEKKPLTATFNDIDEEHLFVIVKKTQMAIAKSDIEQIEARPASDRKARREDLNRQVDPNVELSRPQAPVPGGRPVPSLQNGGARVSYNKPDYELVYRKGKPE